MLFRQLRTRPSWGTPYLKPHRLAVEHLESRIALSVNFVDSGQELAIPDTDSQLSVEAHLGDADGDGDLDAFVLGQDGGPYLVRLWLNDGTGHMRGSDELLHGGDRGDFAIGDLDGDGDLDVVFAKNRLPSRPERYPQSSVWLNDGRGHFNKSDQLFDDVFRLSLGDIDNDGDLDAATVNGREFRVWFNDATGQFTKQVESVGSSRNYSGIEIGDLDGDGDLDAVLLTGTFGDVRYSAEVWFNDGNGHFVSSGQRLYEVSNALVDLGDLDGDGDLDIFATNQDWLNNVWENDGTGVLIDTGQRLGTQTRSSSVTLGDLDGDGDLDALITNQDAPDEVWMNETETSSVPPTYLPGDADRDTHFTIKDILRVSRVGKYATGAAANWSEGDWNSDGVFDRLDIVMALQTDTYTTDPPPTWREPNYP